MPRTRVSATSFKIPSLWVLQSPSAMIPASTSEVVCGWSAYRAGEDDKLLCIRVSGVSAPSDIQRSDVFNAVPKS
jgi:hypothetical protein